METSRGRVGHVTERYVPKKDSRANDARERGQDQSDPNRCDACQSPVAKCTAQSKGK